MRLKALILPLTLALLTACEKEFDDKYEDNLEALNAQAEEIKSSVDQRMAEGREADRALAADDAADDAATTQNDSKAKQ